MGKSVTYIEMTPEELQDQFTQHRELIISEFSKEIRELGSLLKEQAPSLTRRQAALYCDKSEGWIDARRKNDHLPSVNVGGHPRFLRQDLDHLLRGGKFTTGGVPVREMEKSKQETA